MMTSILINGLMVLLLSLWSSDAGAFIRQTRMLMVEDAVAFCPGPLQAYLTKHLATVKEGMGFVDRTRRPADPGQIAPVCDFLVKQMEGHYPLPDDYNVISKFGLLACFIAEIVNPSHKGNSRLPQASEKRLPVVYDGYQPLVDVKQHTDALVGYYRDAYAYESVVPPKILATAYNAAVNEIVDFWTHVWVASGHEIGLVCTKGTRISHEDQYLPVPSHWYHPVTDTGGTGSDKEDAAVDGTDADAPSQWDTLHQLLDVLEAMENTGGSGH
ncbi:MAG: hypothetical protein SWH61_04950 [Thermodesulfobacteriota bacterium]|nr:hypothetical protein [Thermodesulfobacteriota bacterium]